MENNKNNMIKIPIIGLGTCGLKDDICKESIFNALESGYRLIDTASIYRNEIFI